MMKYIKIQLLKNFKFLLYTGSKEILSLRMIKIRIGGSHIPLAYLFFKLLIFRPFLNLTKTSIFKAMECNNYNGWIGMIWNKNYFCFTFNKKNLSHNLWFTTDILSKDWPQLIFRRWKTFRRLNTILKTSLTQEAVSVSMSNPIWFRQNKDFSFFLLVELLI
jgi:hypothetical protein